MVLNGVLSYDGGEPCSCFFEWGTTTAYGNTTGSQIKSTGDPFSVQISGLLENTEYHFRAVATNSSGTSYGEDMTFLTPPRGTPNYFYHLGSRNLSIPYEDKDRANKLHVVLENLSPTTKVSGPWGEVSVEIKYHLAN
ncbi:hypothetical protein ES703_65218 [subsurface metagenome]